MPITPYTDPVVFLTEVQPFLERHEARNSLILGILTRLAEHPDWIDSPPYLALARDDENKVCLAAVITPPHRLLLAAEGQVSQALIDRLCNNLTGGGWTPPGVSAEQGLAKQFADTWAAITGQSAQIRMRMRLYELRQVLFPPRPPAGCLRPAILADFDLLSAWLEAFGYESLHEAPAPDFQQALTRQINAGTIFLWDDQGSVSVAAATRPTTHGVSINSVYTPPELRGRGYASACVAALSQRLLESGKQYCALFTDLNYPISNSIYQKIGYRPVCDFNEYIFTGS